MTDSTLSDNVEKCLLMFAQEARELFLDKCVPVLDEVPSPLQMYKDYVAQNKPVMMRNFCTHWPAISKWTFDYLRGSIGDLEVTVALTPDGYADSVHDGRFVLPEERRLLVNKFLDIMDSPDTEKGVYYIQKQNSNFMNEFQPLVNDIDTAPKWGTNVFGSQPDAVNLWIGDERAVTSLHKDHYENLYSVISGWKKFLLIPPSELPFVPYEDYSVARYKQVDGKFCIEKDDDHPLVPWVPIDPLHPDVARYPRYSHCQPIEITVHAGETLFLPSLWFHHVRQSHGCIAVNMWYDMAFGINYNYYRLMESVIRSIRQ